MSVKRVKKTWYDEQRVENLNPADPTAWAVPLTENITRRQYGTEKKVNERQVTMNNYFKVLKGDQYSELLLPEIPR